MAAWRDLNWEVERRCGCLRRHLETVNLVFALSLPRTKRAATYGVEYGKYCVVLHF